MNCVIPGLGIGRGHAGAGDPGRFSKVFSVLFDVSFAFLRVLKSISCLPRSCCESLQFLLQLFPFYVLFFLFCLKLELTGRRATIEVIPWDLVRSLYVLIMFRW